MHRFKRNFDRAQRLWRRESSVGVLNNNNHNNKNSKSAFVVARGDPHFSGSARLCITEPRLPLLVYWIAAVDCSFLLQ
jgi:precorrin-6B methylase 1